MPVESADLPRMRWPRWTGPAVLLISIGGLVWATSSSFFWADDFVNFQVAHDAGLSPALLNDQLFGHWVPGRRLLDWIVQRHRPVSWPLVLGGIAIVIGVSALLLRQLAFDVTRSPVIAWAVAVLLPLTGGIAGTVQWYSGAAEPLPAMPFAIGALILQIRFYRDRRPWTALLGAVLIAISLTFDERAVAVYAAFPVILLLLPGRRRWLRAAILIGTAVVVLGLYLVGQHVFTLSSSPTTPPSLTTLADFVFRGVFENTLPSVFGLPPLGLPGSLLAAIGCAISVLLLVGAVLARSVQMVPVVAWFIAVATVLMGATGWVRGAEFGPSSALEPRYSAALMPIGLVVVALIAARIRRPLGQTRIILTAAGGLTGLALVVGLVSVSHHATGAGGLRWWSRVEAGARAHPGTAFFDVESPPSIVPSAFFPASLLSNVASVLDPALNTRPTTRIALLADRSGSVVPAEVRGSGDVTLESTDGMAATRPGCWHVVSGEGSLYYRVTPAATAERIYLQGRLEVTGDAAATIYGGASRSDVGHGFGASAALGSLPSGSSWFTAGLSRQRVAWARIAVAGSGEVCVSAVQAGRLVPVSAGH